MAPQLNRTVLKGAASTAIAAGTTALGAPMIWAQYIKNITLRQFGTAVSNLNHLVNKVIEDLGFTLETKAMAPSSTPNYDKIAGPFRSGLLTPASTIAQATAPHTSGPDAISCVLKSVMDENQYMLRKWTECIAA